LDIFYKKTLCFGKTAITFAYEVGLKSFLYEKVSTRKVTSKFNDLWSFRQILEPQNSKGKMQFFDVLVFGAKKLRNLHHLAVAHGHSGALRVSVDLKAHPTAHDVSKQTHIRGIFNGGF
jgi:hypothetical protein